MALINMNNYYNSKIDSINERIISNEKVLNFNKELLREECDQKIKKYEKELKQSLYPLELALSNLDEEVNKRLPNLMLKYNEINAKRKEIHPLDFPNSGSIFKNPDNLKAYTDEHRMRPRNMHRWFYLLFRKRQSSFP